MRAWSSAGLVFLCACLGAAADPAPQAPADFLAADLDPATKPGDDFFDYANGGWLKNNPIPATEPSWGIFQLVRDQLFESLKQINEQAAASGAAPGSDEQKIGDFWSTAMDEDKARRLGSQPIEAELRRIDAIGSLQQALDEAFALQALQVEALFRFGISQDEKDSRVMSVHLGQGGLGMPDRDYYLNPDKGVAHTRQEYVAHVARVLVLLGRSEKLARTDAARFMAFETQLARASRKLEDTRDPITNYHRISPAALSRQTPSIEWTARLAAWNLHPEFIAVGQPEYLRRLQKALRRTPLPVLRDYLRFHLVAEYAAYLSPAFDDEHFRFYGVELSGQKEQRPRWKRVLAAENGDWNGTASPMGMVLGRRFVAEHFPAATKQRYSDLVDAVLASYREHIARLGWMSEATRARAQEKLAAVIRKVGYPDRWPDYSAYTVGRESYADNMMRVARWRFDYMIATFGKPVDRSEWQMTPQTYNAYYNPSNNEIVLPAAIFVVPGVQDGDIDDAVAYGYVGASTIGHEITHGFDDQGRKFDALGNLNDWWTQADAAEFERRAQVMVQQFNAYEPLPGLHINGKACLGENIADYGGILIALDAFKKTAQYKEGKAIGGLTPMQRFFLGYAYGWMEQQRDARTRTELLSDVHAPPKWRVLGPLANVPDFYEAFGVKPGQPMWRPEQQRVSIW
jgi:putative endopeptidase